MFKRGRRRKTVRRKGSGGEGKEEEEGVATLLLEAGWNSQGSFSQVSGF